MAMRTIFTSRWWRILTAALALGAVGCWFVPLVNAAGAEFPALFAIPASILGACTGIATVRIARGHPLTIFAQAVPAAIVALVPPIVIALIPPALGFGRLCDLDLSLAFWAWTPM